jgi:hypothetical protein
MRDKTVEPGASHSVPQCCNISSCPVVNTTISYSKILSTQIPPRRPSVLTETLWPSSVTPHCCRIYTSQLSRTIAFQMLQIIQLSLYYSVIYMRTHTHTHTQKCTSFPKVYDTTQNVRMCFKILGATSKFYAPRNSRRQKGEMK